MTSTSVIQTRVLGFNTVDRAIITDDFVSYLWDDVSTNKGQKVRGICRLSVWEQVPIDHKLDRWFVHSESGKTDWR